MRPGGNRLRTAISRQKTHESVIHEEKEIRADGGCLGFRRRGRTRQAAKMHGEPQAGIDPCVPCVSEWGNPAGRSPVTPDKVGERGELKHLSTRRKRKKTIDCRSSGERTGKSPNRGCRGSCGVVGADIRNDLRNRNGLERPGVAGDTPVRAARVRESAT